MKIIPGVILVTLLTGLSAWWLIGPDPTPAPLPTVANPVTPISTELKDSPPAEQPIRYFFDTEGHSVEEIQALLERAEELQISARKKQQEMKIAMVMHGPDLELFAVKNYTMYKELVDTAARLDDSGMIDFKACEMVMNSRGLSEDDLPDFFEPVPFGPAEIDQLLEGGYVRL